MRERDLLREYYQGNTKNQGNVCATKFREKASIDKLILQVREKSEINVLNLFIIFILGIEI